MGSVPKIGHERKLCTAPRGSAAAGNTRPHNVYHTVWGTCPTESQYKSLSSAVYLDDLEA